MTSATRSPQAPTPAIDSRLPAHPALAVDRSRTLTFTFGDRTVEAHEGESIAAALYAAGVRIFSRSFKYHRPRGLLCVSGRCANCLMEVDGVPNVRTCTEPARAGVTVRAQHAWPSLERDVFACFDKLDRCLPVGFYYKTFIHPTWLWPTYEKVLRHLAALGCFDPAAAPDGHGERVHVHTDVAVIGGGPAGIAAALEAARLGLDVVLIDDQPALGGYLRWRRLGHAGGGPGYEVARALAERVAAEPRIRHLPRATAFGLYEGRLVAVMQGECLLKVRAQRVVVATGGFEHPLVFQNNDRPGVFLGDGVLKLTTLYGVNPGRRAVVVANGERGLRVARELLAAGLEIAAVADARPAAPDSSELPELHAAGVPVLAGHTILEVQGKSVERAVLVRLDGAGRPIGGSEHSIACDLVAVTTGWEPATALLAHADGKLRWRAELGAFYPDELPAWLFVAGEVRGALYAEDVERDGRRAGLAAALSLGAGSDAERTAADALERQPLRSAPTRPLVSVAHASSKRFVCLCEDVTEKDIGEAVREGFDHIETAKRYTTVTMGPCQGKMCHLSSIGVCAAATERSVPDTGTTTARPPVMPVPLGVLAGPHQEPVRRTPMHHQHGALAATWMDLGAWKRPLTYSTVEAECRAVHERVGLIDVSTLGKLEVQGRDAGAFLDWIHPNRLSDLKPGRIRYRVMLDDAGIILDDGTVARVDDDRWLVTTGSGSVESVHQWLDWWLASGDRCAHVTDLTAALGAVNVAGPRSRELLARLADFDVSSEAVPYLATLEGKVAGVPVIVLRIGFVGELGYEMHFPAEYGDYLWETLLDAGRDLGITPFGVEAQRVLRLEKLHIIPGQDTDALSNPLEATLAWTVRADKPDFIGRAALQRAQARGPAQRLVAFEMATRVVPGEGSAVVGDGGTPVGRVTSAKWSWTVGRAIGMAWVPPAFGVEGAELRIRVDGRVERGRVVTKPFYDPDGARVRS